ncbi:hypothetical protein SYNTR_0781 [Candidatus Syntrophocurvum alkaliphilum]|uniref:UspA domain-containing protein n=1 Tax=Candidatus Syntrophocurvum alkaliphilum TaxID=2293317 RepID=A0A6I6DFI4_9FIRM|nr:universal stress protein [Candidatus Syntrophocurvum alkaliphilum]QGT99374.1 hypothetical protein SYNTR_0781 [Candidatus Syntrophocurvum alkaliphilum]
MFEKVLFPVDINKEMKKIIKDFNLIDSLGIKKINLLNVINSGLTKKEHVQKELSIFADTLKVCRDVEISVEIAEGHVATEITRIAREQNYDLIYLPSSYKNIMSQTFLGSVTSDIVRLTDSPTFIHKIFPKDLQPLVMNNILFATDFKEGANKAIPFIYDIGTHSTRLIIQHVGRRAADPLTEKQRIRWVEQNLMFLKENFSPYFNEIILNCAIGVPSVEINRLSSKEKIDLIIVGRSNYSFKKKLLGSTSERLVNTTRSSLLLIP